MPTGSIEGQYEEVLASVSDTANVPTRLNKVGCSVLVWIGLRNAELVFLDCVTFCGITLLMMLCPEATSPST